MTLTAGDVLLLPAFYAHSVDTLTASVSFSVIFPSQWLQAHLSLSDGIVSVSRVLLHQLEGLSDVEISGARYKEYAGALLRLLLRKILYHVLQEKTVVLKFLDDHWEAYARQPESRLFSSSTPPADLCTFEEQLQANQLRLGGEVTDYAIELAEQIKESDFPPAVHVEELKYIVDTVLLVAQGAIPEQQQAVLDTGRVAAWYSALGTCADGS